MKMVDSLKNHWQEYLIEAFGLGVFMISACAFGVLFFNPAVAPPIDNAFWRRGLMGAAMGATAILIICSPFGKRSGAHINPAVTLTYLRLGKIKSCDAIFYIIAQFVGGSLGVLLCWLVFGKLLEDSAVNYVVTAPNEYGITVAFVAEFVISFVLMTTILVTTNAEKLSRFTPFFAGSLVATFITFETPFSGMSINPARTFASAIVANNFTAFWIYFIAPPLAMLAAAEVYRRIGTIYCAKLHHRNSQPCIFNCGYAEEHNEVIKQAHLLRSESTLQRVSAGEAQRAN